MPGQVELESRNPEPANLNCIHCGICLSVCPTYLQEGKEADSPRGRIYLIDATHEGRVNARSPVFQNHMHLCLECRACETACPSGVRFSQMMIEARAQIRTECRSDFIAAALRRIVFSWLLPSRGSLHFLFGLLRFYQRSGIQRLVRRSGVLRLFPRQLRLMESFLPSIPRFPRYDLAEQPQEGETCQVSLFEGCIMPELFGPVHEATLRVLRKNGVGVRIPPRQTCCGALHLHDGELGGARALARRNIDAFESIGTGCIVVNAAGCGAMLKEYGRLLEDDPRYAERAAEFSRRIRDISEFLDELGIGAGLNPLQLKVTYDDPCHLLHGQGIRAAPRRLLRAIPGLELVELRDADRCCGSAGIYNLTHPEMSNGILDEKLKNLEGSGAQVVASGNPGCLLQIQSGLKRKGIPMTAVHPIELLDRAYAESTGKEPDGY